MVWDLVQLEITERAKIDSNGWSKSIARAAQIDRSHDFEMRTAHAIPRKSKVPRLEMFGQFFTSAILGRCDFLTHPMSVLSLIELLPLLVRACVRRGGRVHSINNFR